MDIIKSFTYILREMSLGLFYLLMFLIVLSISPFRYAYFKINQQIKRKRFINDRFYS